jgi:hypothetical protein
MKISIEQVNRLLSALQGGAVVVANEQEADVDANLDLVIDNIGESIGSAIRPTLEQQLKPTLEAGFTGRYLGALRSAAQRVFNVHKRELEDMTIEQVLARCKAELDEGYTATSEAARTAMEQAILEHEKNFTLLKDTYEQQLATERARYTQRDVATRCKTLLERMPRKGGDIAEQAEMLQYKMNAAYELRYNEEKQILEFYKEGKPVLDANSQPLTDETFAQAWATRAGILVNDMRHVKPADVKAGQQGQYTAGIINMGEDKTPGSMEAIAAWAGE